MKANASKRKLKITEMTRIQVGDAYPAGWPGMVQHKLYLVVDLGCSSTEWESSVPFCQMWLSFWRGIGQWNAFQRSGTKRRSWFVASSENLLWEFLNAVLESIPGAQIGQLWHSMQTQPHT